MARVFKRLTDQVAQRSGRHRPMRPGMHVMLNSLLAWALEVDDHFRSQLASGETPDRSTENLLVAGEHLREDAKRWLGGE